MGILTYLKSFVKDPDVASVAPSSKYTIEKVCKPVDFTRDLVIIEYGAATGVFARYLLPRLTSGSKLILFETNRQFFNELKEIKDPRVELHLQSVEHVEEVAGADYMGRTDYIISGIPFSFLNAAEKNSILKQSKKMLKEGGYFLAYQTSGHLKKWLYQSLGNVDIDYEWRNLPPMTIYRAKKEKPE